MQMASALVIVLLCCFSVAQAQTQYFRIGGGGAWNSPTNWSLSSGGAPANAVPGAGDIAVFDNLSGSPVITLTATATVGQLVVQGGGVVRFNAGSAQLLDVVGIAGSSTAPLFVNALSELRVGNNVTIRVGAGSPMATNGASIFGRIAAEIGATIDNNSTRPFFVEAGGTLEMAGGTYTNSAGTIAYALTGTRGTLAYTRPDNVAVIIPGLGMNEMPPAGTPIGNLLIRRGIPNAFTSFTDGPAAAAPQYVLRGTLTVESSVFTLGDQGMTRAVNVVMAASRMLGGGRIQGNAFSVLQYQDDMMNPLNPATSDLEFVTTPLNTFQNDGAGLFGLIQGVRTLNLTLRSSVNIYGQVAFGGGLQITSPTMPLAGQVTINAGTVMSLRNNSMGAHSTSQIDGNNNGRLIVNGTLSISTGATLTNNNNSGGSNPLSGIVVNGGGRIQIWGGDNNAGTTGIIGANGRTYYAGPTAILEYADQGDGTTSFAMAPTFSPATVMGFSQTPKAANRAELPEQMLGTLLINRTSRRTQDVVPGMAATMGDGTYVLLPQVPVHPMPAGPSSTRLLGPLNLQNGTLGLNETQLFVDGPVTTGNGGFIAGNDAVGAANTDALVFRATNPGTLRVTGATIAAITSGRNFNHIEIGGSGNLTMGGTFNIDGDAAVLSYGQNGVANYNGQLRFTGTGNLVMASSDMSFSGAGPANVTIAAQGGHIPVTTGTIGAIVSDAGANITFNSLAARSFPRFASGGQVINNFTIGHPMTAPTAIDYLVSLRTPLSVNGILLLRSNAVLQLGPGGDLTYRNANIQFANPAAPQNYGNIIDASQGGRLTVTNVPNASFSIPVAVGFSQVPYPPAGGVPGLPAMSRLVTIDNTMGLNGDNYTVTVTSAIVNLIPSLPELVNRSMRGQWNITRNAGAPLTGNITLNWTTDVFVPADGSGSEPNGAGQFQPRMIANPPLTTMRRWNGTTYSNVLPVTTPLPGTVTAAMPQPRQITAQHSGALNNSIFIITNELFPIYWVGGSNDDWGNTNHWASTSGGVPGSANVPGLNDFAIFDRGVTTTIRRNLPRVGATPPTNGLQKLRIEGNSNVTFAPTDFPTVMELVQNELDENLGVERGSRLALGENSGNPLLQPITLRIPNMAAVPPMITLTNAPSAGIFGRLTLQQQGTFEYANTQANNVCLIANGASLEMAGGTFVKAAGSTLQYGQNQFSTRGMTAPFYGVNAALAYANATLMYTASGGGTQLVTPAMTNELPMATLNARLVVNRPAMGAIVRINASPYQVSSSVTIQAGIFDMNGNIFQAGVGTYPATGNVPNLDRALNVAAGAFLRGNNTTVLALNGMGPGTLRFEPATSINTLVLNDLSTAATLSGVSTTLLTDLVVNDLQVVNGTRAVNVPLGPDYGWRHALTVASPNTLRLNGAVMNNITMGRVMVEGTMQVAGGATVAIPDLFAHAMMPNGGLDVSTTGTLNLIDGTANAINTVTAAPAAPGLPTNIVRYLAPASRLLLTNNPATAGGLKGLNAVEMPYVFAGSIVVDKTGATPLNNMVQPNFCRAVTAGTLTILNGFYDMNNFALKIGGDLNPATTSLVPPPYIYSYPDVRNQITSAGLSMAATGSIIPFNTTPLVPNSAAFIYNSNTSTNVLFKQQVPADMLVADPVDGTIMYPAIHLNKFENNGSGTLTLRNNTVLRIDGTAGLTACEASFAAAGQMRLSDRNGSLALNGSRVVFTGIGAGAGLLVTYSTGGTVIGDAAATTSLRFASTLPLGVQHSLRAGSSSPGNQFNNIQVEPAVAPVNPATYLEQTNNITVQDYLLRRGIVTVTNSTLTIVNSTTGNITAGQANFGEPNQNYFNTTSGFLALTIPPGQRRMFPVATYINTLSVPTPIRLAPVMIFNGSGASDVYTVGARRGLTNQEIVYGSRVNVEWDIRRGVGSSVPGQAIQFGWHSQHETNPPGFNRGISFPAQWNGMSYTQFANTVNDPTFPGTPPAAMLVGPQWTQNVALPTTTFSATQPWVVIAPPVATQIAASTVNVNNFDGFNSGNLVVTSGVPFQVVLGAFNGFGNPSPVIINTPVGYTIAPAGMSPTAIFNVTPAVQLLPFGGFTVPANPVQVTEATLTIDWLNPGNQTSTQATMVLSAPGLVPRNVTFTVLAPPILPVRIAFAQTQGSSTSTIGFNNTPLGPTTDPILNSSSANASTRFNLRGGIAFPVQFGLYDASNLLRGLPSMMQEARTFVISISNPPGGAAIFSTTGNFAFPVPGHAGATPPPTPTTTATLPVNTAVGAMLPIFNWTGFDLRAAPNAPVSRGLAMFGPPVAQVDPMMPLQIRQPFGVTSAIVSITSYLPHGVISTSVTVTISTGSTIPTRLGMSPISGALNPEFIRTMTPFNPDSAGIQGFNTTEDGLRGNTGFLVPQGPIVSGSQVPIWVSSFGDNGAIIAPPAGTVVQAGITNAPSSPSAMFFIDMENTGTLSTTTGSVLLRPRIRYTNAPPAGGTAEAIVTITRISGGVTLLSTQITIQVSSSSTIPVHLAYNRNFFPNADTLTGLGFERGPGVNVTTATVMGTPPAPYVEIEAGRPFNFNVGLFNNNKTGNGIGTGQLQITNVQFTPLIPGEVLSLAGTTLATLFQETHAQFSGTIINWNPLTPVARTISMTVSGVGGLGAVNSTTVTIRLLPPNQNPGSIAFSTQSENQREGLQQQAIATLPFVARVGLFSTTGLPITSLSNLNIVMSVSSADGVNSFQIDPNFTVPAVLVNQQFVDIPVRVSFSNATMQNQMGQALLTASVSNVPTIRPTSAVITLVTTGTLPVITNFSPAFGGVGTTISIQGVNFTGVNAVTVAGSPANIISVSPGQIIAVITSCSGSGPITVSRPAGPGFPAGTGVSSSNFTCGVGAGGILSFSPGSGGTGTVINVVGTTLSNGMGSLTGATSVTVAGLQAEILSNNGTTATIRITGQGTMPVSGPILFITPLGPVSSSTPFNYTLGPVITSITPASFIANGQTIAMTINGANFSTTGQVPEGLFIEVNNNLFGAAAQPFTRTANQITFFFPGQLNVTPGVRRITVRNVDNQFVSFPVTLLPAPAPSIANVSPSVTTATGSAFAVVVAGQNFFAPAGLTVTINGNPAQFAVNNNRDSVTVLIPVTLNNQAGTLNIVLRNADGQSVTTQVRINEAPMPRITALNPPRVNVGSPTTRLTIAGTGFFFNAGVQVSNFVLTPLSITPTQIVVDVPAMALTMTRNLPVIVQNADGKTASSILPVTLPSPTITSILPSTNASQFSFIMTINGTNFRPNAVVQAGTTPLQVLQIMSNQIQARFPAMLNVQGIQFITVTNTDDTSPFASTTATFSIGASTAPRVDQITPFNPPANGTGFDITIRGANFSTSPPPTITYGGTALAIRSISPTEIVVAVPPGLNTRPGLIPIVVTNPDGQIATVSFATTVRVMGVLDGKLFPNPVDDEFTIEAELKRPGLVTMRLTDALGRVISEVRESYPAGGFRRMFNVNALPPGLYIFELNDGERRLVEKVIKQ
jgi:hypothetical protein